MTYQLLVAAKQLASHGIEAEVVHVPTIKPLDETTILASVRKTGRAVAAEEAQMAAGFGGAVAELLSGSLPTPLLRIGMDDRYGESGVPIELMAYFGLDGASVATKVKQFCDNTPRYHQGF
jgi:transketolase